MPDHSRLEKGGKEDQNGIKQGGADYSKDSRDMSDYLPAINENNPDPRVSCALLLDTSGSMSGEKIRALNAGFRTFCEEIQLDPLARKRAEIMVITFGDTVRIAIPFTEARNLSAMEFAASGSTPLGSAIETAIDQLAQRKALYKQSGLEYYRPWLFVLTDGQPTDRTEYDAATQRTRELESRKALAPFAVGIGGRANLRTLAQLSAVREPLRLDGLKFREYFQWLSASLTIVSNSHEYGPSDIDIVDAEIVGEEQNPLPSPKGWATW